MDNAASGASPEIVLRGVAHRVPLTQMARGARGVVCGVGVQDESVLAPMGLRDRSSVRVCRLGEPCIVEVGCAPGMCRRIGLSKSVAERVMVELDERG